VGKWNGCGGKLLAGESYQTAAVRELAEEIGVVVSESDLIPVGHLMFYFPHKPDFDHDVEIFLVRKWQNLPQETDEMRPQWFAFDQVPYDQMWADDKFWMPKVLAGKTIEGECYFTEDDEGIIKFDLRER